MYLKLESNRDDLLAYKIAGRVTTEEYQEIKQDMERAIETHGKIRMLVEIGHLRFPEIGVLWEDLKFGAQHLNDFIRFAAIGDKAWEKWWVTVVGKLVPMDAQYFDISDSEKAWYWVQSDN